MAIRHAIPADIPRLLPLVEAYWRFESLPGSDAATVGASLTQLVTSPDLGAVWIAEADETPVPLGYLVLVYVFSLEHGGLTAEIDELFVTPEARGNGIGRSLLRTAEAACTETGCRHLSLQVGTRNEVARAFYRAMGFAPRDGFDLLEKDLS